MASHYRNEGKGEPVPVSSNRFEVLKVRVMQREEEGSKEVAKDRTPSTPVTPSPSTRF